MGTFRIPYYYPNFDAGNQIVNLQPGGSINAAVRDNVLRSNQPRIHPAVFNVTAYGLGNMPRQNIGPTQPITPNNYSDPSSISNLQIAGLYKK